MNKKNWDKFAPIYNIFMWKNHKAYEQMYELIRKEVENKTVLELATGTGLIAKNIGAVTRKVDATDYSEEMIKVALKGNYPKQVRFSIEDANNLSFISNFFDVVIISNALHIMSEPRKVLCEIARVLNKNGILIAPIFTHGNLSLVKRMLSKTMRIVGFQVKQKWTTDEYLEFLRENGWKIRKMKVIKAAFPLTYVVCSKM